MNLKNNLLNKILIMGAVLLIPVCIILVVILGRHVVTPSNEDIINELKNTKYYSSKVDYVFKNSKSQFEESTMQYYSADKGSRIEFQEGSGRVKVYNGGEIRVEGNEDNEYTIEKDIDVIYPLAFMENILSNPQIDEIKEVKAEWGDGVYLQVNIQYQSQNKHLSKAEFYIDKNKEAPVLLKVLDDSGKERIIINYKDFKKEKSLSDDLF